MMAPFYAGGMGIPYMMNMGYGGLSMMGMGGLGMYGGGYGAGYPYGSMMQNPYMYTGMVRPGPFARRTS